MNPNGLSSCLQYVATVMPLVRETKWQHSFAFSGVLPNRKSFSLSLSRPQRWYTDYADFNDRLQRIRNVRETNVRHLFYLEEFSNDLTAVKIIISAGAGPGDNTKAAQRLADIFKEDQIDIDISLARSGAEVIELARKAAREPYKVIVAAGGDGTVNSVAAAVIDNDKILGVLPLGTLNHFARDLGIPADLQQAARTIIAGHTIEVDAAEVNDRIFLNNSSLGLYPMIVREREKHQRLGFGKWPAFVWATIQALRRNPFLDVRLRVNDELLDRTTPFVFVGNNEYAMDLFNIGMRDRLDRGELSIYITHGTSRLKLIALGLRAVVGRLRNDKDFLALRSNEVKIQTARKRVRVAFDGEIEVMAAPLQYRVRSRALRVIVPKDVKAG